GADALRAGRDPARHQERAGQDRARRVEEHLGQPDDVEPPGFAGLGHREHLAKRLGLIDSTSCLLQEDSEVHATPSDLMETRHAYHRGGAANKRCPPRSGEWYRIRYDLVEKE